VGYTRVNIATSGSVRKQEGWTDWLGRTTKVSRPGFTGQPAFEEQSFFDSATGRLIKSTRTGYASTLYQYDALSQPMRSGLDLNANDALDLSGADRIADSDQYFEYLNSAWWLTKVAKTYPTANSGTALTVATSRQRLTGFTGNLRAEVVSVDTDGNISTQTTTVDRANKTTIVTTTVSGVANTQSVTYKNGLPTSTTGFDGLTFTTGYDALGRPSTSIDPRTGTTTTTYKPGSTFVYRIQDAAGNYVSTYTYDNAGRTTSVTNADGKVTRFQYNTLDQVVYQWGDAAYPVEYGYNSYGERETMKTYRGGSNWAGTSWPGTTGTADQTTWSYDGPSGLLASKTDAAGKPVTFTYNTRGQTATRTWARGVVTTYAYYGDGSGEPKTGELKSQTYSDTTPAVSFTYTRAGQLDTAADVIGTRTFIYNTTQPLRLDALSLPAFYGSRVQTRQYDAVKRPTGFLLGTTGNLSGDLTQTYGYHATSGRFDNLVTASSAQASRTFTYGYNTGGLVSGLGITGSPFSVTRGYEPNRNLLTSIDSKWNATSRTRYDYTYNVLSQRESAKQSGDVFADFGGSTYYRYAYNARGEVTEAVDYQGENASSTASPQLVGRRFGYTYDNLGNRSTGTRSLGTGIADQFTANALNQYTSRENDVAYVAGTARADSMIAVTGGTTSTSVARAGRYFGTEVTLNNTSGPAKTLLTLTATLASPNLTRTETRTAYLPPSLQSFTYDDDGNLKGDGLWNYTYDAENRLITMTATTAARNAGYADRLLEFKYDYLGRRVQKRSAILSTTGGFMPGDTYTRYLYDGWNLVAEFAATGSSIGSLQRSYTWGLDLAGSLTATGGVGALIQITDHGASTAYFPTYDGNGNIASLLRASDGTVVAKYEYSPFGELLRTEGSYAANNPFRFSTKFTDDESGLVYYGARYYSPSLSRFINRDPIAEQGGLNLYGFCGNDGINHTDYLGYSWLSRLLKAGRRAIHQVTRALLPIRALRGMDRRLERWEDNHQEELKLAAAIVAAIVTYGATSEWVAAQLSATTMTVAADGTVIVTASGSGLMAASLSAASGVIGGVVGGAAAGAVSGVIMTGTAKGALQGAAAGAIMGGIAGYYGRSWTLPRVGVTAVGGGLASKVSGGSFRQGALISGGIALVTYGAIKMREYELAHSDPRDLGRESAGFNGDRDSLAGSRSTVQKNQLTGEIELVQKPLPFGGSQGSEVGTLFGKAYGAGSWQDRLLEAYAGPHDFLGHPWGYNGLGFNDAPNSPFGRVIASVAGNSVADRVSDVMGGVDLLLATPIVAASAVGVSPGATVAVQNAFGRN